MKFYVLIVLISSFRLCCSQVEPGVLDGVYVKEHVPRAKKYPYGAPYIEELEDTVSQIEYLEFTSDSLELVYTHSTYGVITKRLDSMISIQDALVQKLEIEGEMFCSHRFLNSLILANYMDRIQLFHNGELVFSIRYYNFSRGALYRRDSVLFDDLLVLMQELRAITPKLEEPIYPSFSTD